MAVSDLVEAGLATVDGSVLEVSRRSLIARLGAGAAAVLPVVESITAPSPAAGLSRRPTPSPKPTTKPTPAPTPAPTAAPIPAPTPAPTAAPKPSPTP